MKKLMMAVIFVLMAFTINAYALVSDISPKSVLYVGDGATTVFSFVFTVETSSDIDVILTDSSNTETTLTPDTDYTVIVNANGTGSITTVTTYTSANQLMIRRDTEETQALDLQEGGYFSMEALEDALDKGIRISQENNKYSPFACQPAIGRP